MHQPDSVQQDRATFHITRAIIQLLSQILGKKNKFSRLRHKPYYPDLTSPESFPKEKLCQQAPIPERKYPDGYQSNRARNTVENILELARLCGDENGGHLKDVIFLNSFKFISHVYFI